MHTHEREFLALALERQALRFGSFTLKSGRTSPYFFNAGLFNDGAALARLGRCYADAVQSSGLAFDMLFGPAYKGIPLVAATAIALADRHGRTVPWSFNRKEAKSHGDGGTIVGTPLAGRVLIVDDVITAGTAIRESIEIIRAAGAEPVGVALALDRQERGQGSESAVQEVQRLYGLRCISILTLGGLIRALGEPGAASAIGERERAALEAYREQFGVSG